jgi:hypothetical protein
MQAGKNRINTTRPLLRKINENFRYLCMLLLALKKMYWKEKLNERKYQ